MCLYQGNFNRFRLLKSVMTVGLLLVAVLINNNELILNVRCHQILEKIGKTSKLYIYVLNLNIRVAMELCLWCTHTQYFTNK